MISVCIPTVRPATLGDAVRAIRAQQHRDWQLVVIGQGDEQLALRATVDEAAAGDERVRYVHLEQAGLSRARNAALASFAGEVIAFTDDDCEADPSWLAEIADAFARHPRSGVVAGSMLRPPRTRRRLAVCPDWVAPELLYEPADPPTEAPSGWGAAGGDLALRRSTVDAVGDFDEQLGAGATFGAAEDIDYLMRVERLAIPMYATPRVVVRHTHGYRYGARAVYRQGRNYARGNGALAAKLTLLGDERGERWRRHEIRQAVWEPLRRVRPHRLPVRVLRLAHFLLAYRACRRSYVVDPPGERHGTARCTLRRRGV
jgi:glycosyltransferase involved in cell wall biosynthesis